MFTKRCAIALLVGLNLLLLAVLVFSSYSLPFAHALGDGRPGDFASVTAKAGGQSYDVLYVLDLPDRKLYAFYSTSAQTRRLAAAPPRDLSLDFPRK